MTRTVVYCAGLCLLAAAAVVCGEAGSGDRACETGCDMWEARIWFDRCQVYTHKTCWDDKKVQADQGGPCVGVISGELTIDIYDCELSQCSDVCNAASCFERTNCQQNGAISGQHCSLQTPDHPRTECLGHGP